MTRLANPSTVGWVESSRPTTTPPLLFGLDDSAHPTFGTRLRITPTALDRPMAVAEFARIQAHRESWGLVLLKSLVLADVACRPGDFSGMTPMSNQARKTTALVESSRQGPDTSLAHRSPGYPLAGCFPAEPASMSPGVAI